MNKYLARIALGFVCVVLLLGHARQIWPVHFISALDAYLYDARVRLFMHNVLDQSVVIVDIDEKSLGEIGRWPWGRNVVADLVRRLTDDYQAAVVGFDLVLAEPDQSSGLGVLEAMGRQQLKNIPAYQQALGELRASLDYDQLFADALRGQPVVLGYYFSDTMGTRQVGALPAPAFPAGHFSGQGLSFVSRTGYGANLSQFQAAAASGGHFIPLVDADGKVRRVPMLVEFQGAYYESLSLAVLRTLLGRSELRLAVPANEVGIESLDIVTGRSVLRIPVDDHAATLIPFRGAAGSFPYVSAVDVLKGRVALEQLAGRVVLVGTTAPGLNDLRNTPVGGAYPGVEVHANLVAGMLAGTIKERPGYEMAVDALQILLIGGLLVLLLPLLSPLRATLLAMATLVATLLINLWLWQAANLVLPLASAILLIILLYALNMSWGYFVETRTKRQFAELFGQYVPPELVDEMARNPQSYSMKGRNAELTVLFADVRNFTSLSEGMDPKELSYLMNDYLGAMTEVIRGERGTLDKYIGDAIMAFWGAPVSDAEHARHAVLSALAMQQALANLVEPFRARGWPALQIGIGINTGMMTVGDMGSPVRKAYTVMGDAVNLAARLEAITKTYGVGIVVGETTRLQVGDVCFREIDRVRVKGKDEPVTIYEPLGLASALSAATLDELARWEGALKDYRAQEWAAASAQIDNLIQSAPGNRLYNIYAERIIALRTNPPESPWDGVTTFLSK